MELRRIHPFQHTRLDSTAKDSHCQLRGATRGFCPLKVHEGPFAHCFDTRVAQLVLKDEKIGSHSPGSTLPFVPVPEVKETLHSPAWGDCVTVLLPVITKHALFAFVFPTAVHASKYLCRAACF